MKNILSNGRKLALILITIGFISPVVFGASQSIELKEGWNTVSIDIQDVSSSDLQDECSGLNAYQGEHIWVLEGDSWSNPDTMPTAKGVYLTTSSDCTIDLEGDSANPSELSITKGWNLISLSGDLTWSNVLKCDIQQYEDYKSWILTGNSWSHLDSSSSDEPPTPGDGGNLEDKGVLLKSGSECTVSASGAVSAPPTPDEETDDSTSTDDSDSSDTDDSTNTDDTSNTDDSDDADTEINPGDLYFRDTEANKALVNNEAGSPGDKGNLRYDMYDDDVIGGFTSHASSRAERTIVVENKYSGETVSRTDSGLYVGIPKNSHTWGTEESGIYKMGSYGSTEFLVQVKDPDTGNVLQEVNTFRFNPSSQPRTITTDFKYRNTDHVRISGSNLEIDGSGDKNSYVTWSVDSSEDKTVEIDFVVNDEGHTRLEVCENSCNDGNEEIAAAYYLYGDTNVRIDQPYDNSYDSDPGRGEHQYQTGEEYTFRIIQDGYDVDMEIEGPGVDHSRDLDIYSFDHFSIDTEAGSNDRYPGIDLTVKDVTIEE